MEDGSIFTVFGVSAGMDMALAAVASLFGKAKALEIANLTEYAWNQDPADDPFHQFPNTAMPE